MSRNKTKAECDNSLNTMRGVAHASYTPYVGLIVTMPSSDDGTGLVEPTYAGYARVLGSFSAPTDGPGETRQISNDADLEFAELDIDRDFAGVGVWDAVSGGTLKKITVLDIAPSGHLAGETPRFPAGDLIFIED